MLRNVGGLRAPVEFAVGPDATSEGCLRSAASVGVLNFVSFLGRDRIDRECAPAAIRYQQMTWRRHVDWMMERFWKWLLVTHSVS